MQGARIRTSAVRDIRWISRQVVQLLVEADYVSAFTRIITSMDATIVRSFKAWIPRSEAADKDKLAAISSFAAKTVTTIQRSPDVKARNFFRSLLASIGGKTLEAATAEAIKIRVQTPDFSISTMETVPKESLPVKKATDKEPAAPAVDSPSDMAAEVNPAIQDDATIFRAWLCASIVSIDKKDGDPLNPGDKRGIALINVGLKLVCKVLQMRIERFVETNNLLSYEQAGFRKREECVGQVVSLVDIIQRRQNAGINTHVLFIDIRKAFDTVPVGALLWKLQNMGFPRRTLAFLKTLYTSSSARAWTGSLLSDPFPVQRGVRQG
ncbi:hypothetical protein BASA50_007944 [Batrachochytrium salamandrivorans]|uniref:Reverse transcriptase domain-containing protein n=1 Tax=Batrachochytrium salamandrivorans TaxID=1357716 RepID=A0ABQ8F5M7_9FUNG|nr:hypothetical protein BASA50_007944 [Batrachochytrium salamandrivorans]